MLKQSFELQRILCFELIAKANSNWFVFQHFVKLVHNSTFFRILKYVKGAIGETDVPDALPEFISQRRRWLNGSFFAATYAIAHVGQIMRSGHSFTRKVVLMIETVYNIINLVFSWFSIVSLFIRVNDKFLTISSYFRATFIYFS
jgi:chitin synthase